MRTLLLLRHAKSSWDAADDHERTLAPRGLRAAALVGAYLAEDGRAPDLVLCSTARRAVLTWERAAAQLEEQPRVVLDAQLYLASPERILARIGHADERARRLLVVGHNPGFQQLAVRLAGGPDSEGAGRIGKFATAGLASFEIARGGWSELSAERAKLADFVRPADLV
jgi:phosphohistidine phosphatase